jgi:class 3 adenylate cyclase
VRDQKPPSWRQLLRPPGRELKTMGDGFLASFDGPARAIRCGCAIRDEARRLGIEVRAGLHIGEIELRGDDVAGTTVNIAARVAGVAGRDEIVVSRTVTDLVAGSGIEFEDRGERDLKGVPGLWRLFAVVAHDTRRSSTASAREGSRDQRGILIRRDPWFDSGRRSGLFGSLNPSVGCGCQCTAGVM